MEFVSQRERNPFDMCPPHERYVPGYGDANADFHLIGDHPGVHGGRSSEIPFSDREWSERFFDTLDRGGLVTVTDDGLVTHRTFLSYLHMADPGPESERPDEQSYAKMEPFFDAELRAITAHVLFPVGSRATAHILGQYTARAVDSNPDMTAIHATEIRGAGWLVVPIADPADWTDADADRLLDRLQGILDRDYRQTSDLGRFLAGNNPYFVR